MGVNGKGYFPAPDFEEDRHESLLDVHLNDNTELWLVQLPDDPFPDTDAQKLILAIDQDGDLGTVKGPDGTVYSLVDFLSDVSATTVFVPTPIGTKRAGKISRHVSLIHYPEPNGAANVGPKRRMPSSSKTSFTKSQFSTPTRTMTHRSSQSKSRGESIPSSRRSGLSESSGPSKSRKRAQSGPSRESGDSGLGYSGLTSTTVSGSSEQSHHKKSKANPY